MTDIRSNDPLFPVPGGPRVDRAASFTACRVLILDILESEGGEIHRRELKEIAQENGFTAAECSRAVDWLCNYGAVFQMVHDGRAYVVREVSA